MNISKEFLYYWMYINNKTTILIYGNVSNCFEDHYVDRAILSKDHLSYARLLNNNY